MLGKGETVEGGEKAKFQHIQKDAQGWPPGLAPTKAQLVFCHTTHLARRSLSCQIPKKNQAALENINNKFYENHATQSKLVIRDMDKKRYE
ncbi:hypothetical protein VP01_1303g1 [Puccinia sorghi]|uniref:Uncharacterized protein n=1 Tax=Puccinia sorghi TaxID=27349 RepID=A0A0L6VNK2_9BASI|nr:hypothetical protein VP01_1303g1 [Puccinia sorghi]